MGFGIDVKKYAKKIGQEQPDWSQGEEILDVYLVPIDKLYYNDDNGRIATWISSYLDIANQPKLNELSQEEYNNKLHEFIKKSNTPDSFKKTLNDIRLKGQIRPGVVLSDGRVVSGNRRFTVLRELYKETGNDKFAFFKCFIIDKDLSKEDDRKYIKTIERLTQFGVDEKVDYDPIARLVDIYNDLLGPNKIWSIQEYSRKLQLKLRDVILMCNKASIMVDYLNYINMPNKFYIARKQKLDGPLQELAKIYPKVSRQEWNRIRVVFYSVLPERGDTTRTVRDLIKVYNNNSSKFNELIEKCINDIEEQEIKIIESKNETIIKEPNVIKESLSDQEEQTILSYDTKKEIFDATNSAKLEENRQAKVEKLFKSIDTLLLSLPDTYEIMIESEKKKLMNRINELEKVLIIFKGE